MEYSNIRQRDGERWEIHSSCSGLAKAADDVGDDANDLQEKVNKCDVFF